MVPQLGWGKGRVGFECHYVLAKSLLQFTEPLVDIRTWR